MNYWKLSTFALLAALGAVVSLDYIRPAAAFEEPRLRAAEGSLKMAREHVAHAEHDHGWHRQQTLQAIDQAIADVHAGIAWGEHN
ncbi:MAG TPA: hypothetical protein VGI39_45865 [Polyangiaceae bacterium]|jgi:hypothetical protein